MIKHSGKNCAKHFQWRDLSELYSRGISINISRIMAFAIVKFKNEEMKLELWLQTGLARSINI